MVLNFCGFRFGGGAALDNGGTDNYADLNNKPSINGNTLVGNKTSAELGLVTGNNYGIRADYCTQYGIIGAESGLVDYETGTTDIRISAGITLVMPNKDTKQYLASEHVYTVQSIVDCTIFVVDGEYFEAEQVFWQDEEPNGSTETSAWWSPKDKVWRFKSNETGNVFREAVGTPLCDVFIEGEVITRIDFRGYRLLNDEVYATIEDYKHLEEEVAENAENIGIYTSSKQDKADNALMTESKTIVGAINELKQQIDTLGG